MDLTSLMNNDRLLSPPVTPKSYPLDTTTLSKHDHQEQGPHHDELVVPTEIYIPPVSPPISMDTITSTTACISSSPSIVSSSSSSSSPLLSSSSSYSPSHSHPQRKRKTFKFHLERQKALPLSKKNNEISPCIEIKEEKEIHIPYPLPPLLVHRQQQQQQRHSNGESCLSQRSNQKKNPTKIKDLSSPTIPLSKRKQSIPWRSLSPDAADHAFSLYFNAEQVRQYGMQAILQKDEQLLRKRRRSSSFYHDTIDSKHHHSPMMINNANLNRTMNVQQDDQLSHMTSKRPIASTLASMVDRHMKKARTEAAAAYDRVDVTVDDALVYDPEWVPLYDVFDRKPNVRPTYKGKANSPLQIDHMEFYDQLHPCEVNIASQLRLQPKQYLMCKRSLILGAQDSFKKDLPFRKSDAQKLCRIDVNKVSHLWALFARLGWLEPHAPSSS